jgi:hypothetical protein
MKLASTRLMAGLTALADQRISEASRAMKAMVVKISSR